ncbi:MAG: ATP-binding cassette domain-containing protein [Planctomycetes bacterium]|nr:ATP-binding cassette domain-containing protein [Planctomycetota bacterium]
MTQVIDTYREDEYHGEFNWRVWRRLGRYALRYRRELLTLLGLALVVATVDVLFNYWRKIVIDDIVQRGADWRAGWFVASHVVINLVFCVGIWTFIRRAGRLSSHVSHDIRQDGFEHMQALSFSDYDRRPAGWLVARLTSDCDRLSRNISWGLMDMAWGSCFMLGLAILMLIINWQVGLLVLCVMPVVAWVSITFQRRILRVSRRVRKQNSTITASFNEGIAGVLTSKTMVCEDDNLAGFSGQTTTMYRESLLNAKLTSLYFPLIMTLGGVGLALALYRGGQMRLAIGSEAMTLGDLILFFTCATQFVFPILEMAPVVAEMPNTQASAERVFGLIDTDPDVKDTPEALEAMRQQRNRQASGASAVGPLCLDDAASAPEGGRSGGAIDGGAERIEEVRFEDVGFAYKDGERVLDGFSLTVRAGQSVALVGPTGGGKTTIVSLLCRFYEPTGGHIRFDGVDYRHRSLHWLQSNLGIVLQQPHLFSGSIRENIRYGRLDATDEEVEVAAKLAHAHDFIVRQETGYDAEVGEGGSRLSTGQKQLVSFARAVLADPQIFVMDEATSSVDTETERLIQSALQQMMHNRITFIIAHRLSTCRAADTILVVDGGRIVEQGSHVDLIARRGRYYDLYTTQFTTDMAEDIIAHRERQADGE